MSRASRRLGSRIVRWACGASCWRQIHTDVAMVVVVVWDGTVAEIADQHREELEAMVRSASADKEVALVALGIKAKLSSLENRMQVQ